MPKVVLLGCWGVLVAALLLLQPVPAQAGGTVGTGSAGSCTQAALDAKLAGGGLVTFDCGALPVTIVVTNPKTISVTTTVDGGGKITLSGGGLTPIFFVDTGSLTLRNLTLADGSSKGGGAIENSGGLTLVNTNFISNTGLAIGGAIYSLAPMTITGGLFMSNTTGFGNGGAIYNSGPASIFGATFISNRSPFDGGAIWNDVSGRVVIRTSTLQSNTAANASGGGIFNLGQLVVDQVTFTGNSATGASGTRAGGGLAQASSGSAVVMNSTFAGNQALIGGGLVTSGTTTVSNTTFSANGALVAGGALAPSGTLTVTNSTFQGNMGVFLFGASALESAGGTMVTLKNTIVAGDPTNNCAGSLTSLGHNLDDGHTCGLNASGDLTDTNPLLGPLTNNGGPTQTHALLPGSSAINHGDNGGCPLADQRGFPRIDGCDIGAFEFYAFRLLLPLAKR